MSSGKMQPRSQAVLRTGGESKNEEVGQTGPGHQLGLGSERLNSSGGPKLVGCLLLVSKMGNSGEGAVLTVGEVGLLIIVSILCEMKWGSLEPIFTVFRSVESDLILLSPSSLPSQGSPLQLPLPISYGSPWLLSHCWPKPNLLSPPPRREP